jgi:predicted CXXCH cytochrome family protein
VSKDRVRLYCVNALFLAWTSLVFVGTAEATSNDERPARIDHCVDCHLELGDSLAHPVEQSRGDVHEQRGLGCVGCHGGDASQPDADLAMDPRKGFIGRPTASSVPRFCGKCHSDGGFMRRYNPAQRIDQESEYATSGHGKSLLAGNDRVATCISCHGAHGIKPHTHPQSTVYPQNVAKTCGTCHADPKQMLSDLPTNQLDDYAGSVHAEALNRNDLSAPTCNDCHGNHGATPPGVTSVANVCGTCHSRQADMFRKSVHGPAFEEMGQAECIICHDNHKVLQPSEEMLGAVDSSVCAQCHEAGDKGFEAGLEMSAAITGLENRLRQARSLIDRAGKAGMEVSRATFTMAEGHDALINARVLVHTFSPVELKAETGRGMVIADQSYRMGEDALEDLQFRRKGLALSLVVIVLAVVALYLKIQHIERPEK